MEINDVTPAAGQAYDDYIAATQAHNALVNDPLSTREQRMAGALDASKKWRAAMLALGGPDPVGSEACKARDQLHEAATVALAMIRGIIDIDGFGEAIGEDANLCHHLIHETHDRLRNALRQVNR